MNYKKSINKLKKIQIMLIIVCVLVFVSYLTYVLRPERTTYIIEDECGVVGGSLSHTIDDVDSCSNACSAYCQSFQLRYADSLFIINEPCNTCKCTCEQERFI